MISFIALGIATVALVGVAYVLFVALPKIGGGMEKLGEGLTALSSEFKRFVNSMLR